MWFLEIDAVLVLVDAGHVDAVEGRVHAELRALAGLVGDLAGVQQGLGRDAATVQAGAADLVLLDQHHGLAEFGRSQSCGVAAAATAEDDEIGLIVTHADSIATTTVARTAMSSLLPVATSAPASSKGRRVHLGTTAVTGLPREAARWEMARLRSPRFQWHHERPQRVIGSQRSAMSWFSRRKVRPGTLRSADSADLDHLKAFATRAGRRGLPRAADRGHRDDRRAGRVTASGPVAGSGARRRAALHARNMAIPLYDAVLVGYPQRMREWTARRKADGSAGST